MHLHHIQPPRPGLVIRSTSLRRCSAAVLQRRRTPSHGGRVASSTKPPRFARSLLRRCFANRPLTRSRALPRQTDPQLDARRRRLKGDAITAIVVDGDPAMVSLRHKKLLPFLRHVFPRQESLGVAALSYTRWLKNSGNSRKNWTFDFARPLPMHLGANVSPTPKTSDKGRTARSAM